VVSCRGKVEKFSQRHRVVRTTASMAGVTGLPFLVMVPTALLMFIAAAVSQSWICTRRLPLKRVRLSPCSSFPSPKAPST
jgi:hypothetical protein